MPWLLREDEVDSPEQALLLIHIPRTGGTQLYKEYGLFSKARAGHWPVSWFFLAWLQYRHSLFEASNFPLSTIENFWFGLVMLPLGFLLIGFNVLFPGIWVVSWALFGILFFSYLATAPGLRTTLIRRAILSISGVTQACSYEYMYGADCCKYPAFMLHMTASEMVDHGALTLQQLQSVCSFCFVRNPYRRMVSQYLYSRWGPLETFEAFIHRWHACHKAMRERGEWDVHRPRCDWDVYCHRLPMHVYTHRDGTQMVRFVLRLEDKSLLLGNNFKQGEMPATLQDVLDRMSRIGKEEVTKPWTSCCGITSTGRNARPLGGKAWEDFYTAEIAALVHEMYSKDFEVFGYDPAMPSKKPTESQPVPVVGMTPSAPKESSPLLSEPLMGK